MVWQEGGPDIEMERKAVERNEIGMQTQETKGRFLSDRLKPWHVVLLVLLVGGLFGMQWWLNSTTADQHDDVQRQVQKDAE